MSSQCSSHHPRRASNAMEHLGMYGPPLPLTVQSERKPSKTTDVIVGMLSFCMAEKAALLATAGLEPGPAAAGDVCRGKVGQPIAPKGRHMFSPAPQRAQSFVACLALGSHHSRPLWHLHYHGQATRLQHRPRVDVMGTCY